MWPTWFGEGLHPQADTLNASLKTLFRKQLADDGGRVGTTYVSADDLLHRYQNEPAVTGLFQFLSDLVFRTAHQANQPVWAELGAPRLRVVMVGAWFQVQNEGGRHAIHNHGNCSWSGVYWVDVDDAAERTSHPGYGVHNGVLRFHGPHLARLGGAHMDLGSAYLQRSSHDVAPAAGRAVVFPSWLLHEALPYEGQRDRVAVAFNAQLQAIGSSAGLPMGFG
ncbi:MAG: putative 2OG-Fe(II) oxygenase [Myxococcota bacterium]